jgi:hypothetical protein
MPLQCLQFEANLPQYFQIDATVLIALIALNAEMIPNFF